jgi:nitrate reductase delta subunit
MFYRIISALLEYPDAALRAALPEIEATISAADDVSATERSTLSGFVARLLASDPIACEEEYVRTFDMTPEHSLHLTHHLLGEDKNRGPALIDLTRFYQQRGLTIAANELPDHLPLMLEFVSLLPVDEGRSFLSGWHKILRQLRANLAEGGNTYAALIELVEMRARSVAADDTRVVAAPKTDPTLDDGGFEPPVEWSTPSPCAAALPPIMPMHPHGREVSQDAYRTTSPAAGSKFARR